MSMSDKNVGIDNGDQNAETPLSNAQNKTAADPNSLNTAGTYPSGALGQTPQGSLPGLAGFAQMQGLAPATPPVPVAPQPSVPEPLAYDPIPEPPELAQPELQPFTPVSEQVPPLPADIAGPMDPGPMFPEELPTPSLDIDQPPVDLPPLPGVDQSLPSDTPTFSDPPTLDIMADHARSDAEAIDDIDLFAGAADAGPAGAPQAMEPPALPGQDPVPPLPDGQDLYGGELQAFEAHYDQHPEIPIGAFDAGAGAEGGAHAYFQDHDGDDAEFLENEMSPENVAAGKKRPGRKLVMVSGSLAVALVLGGAIAFAYKQSGNTTAGNGQPPLIQADNRPVKVAPKQPGGKEFPHKNKLIYDRLVGEERPEIENVVPRQEEVADAATTPAEDRPRDDVVAALRQGTDTENSGAANSGTEPSEGPRKVKTLVVRPDGTIVKPETTAAIQPEPQTRGFAARAPEPPAQVEQPAPAQPEPVQQAAPAPVAPPSATAAERRIAAVQTQQSTSDARPAFVAPTPTPKPRAQPQQEQRVAALNGVAPATAGVSGYVVQVAARKSQTDALAAFADLQQRYPKLLSGYRPMIQRADLGDKGTWYRLRVGPMNEKTAAANLCKRLKSAGLRNCLVRAQ